MKILILLKKWGGGVGGGVKNIREEFKQMGHQVEVISREEDLKIFSFAKSIFPLRKLIKEKGDNYDIIYTQDWSLAFPLLFPYAIYKKKHFCMFHGNQAGNAKLIQNIVGTIMGRNLLCMAPSIKKRFPKANINYCGVSFSKFRDLNGERKYLGWMQKGTEMNQSEEIKNLSKIAKIPLMIANGVKYEDMNEKFYNRCKVFISLPPATAGFQACWLEAMAAGVPIVIGNENGAGEIQPFDKIPIGKEHDLLLIYEKIKNPKKINYKKWIKDNDFTWKRHTEKLIEIFNKK